MFATTSAGGSQTFGGSNGLSGATHSTPGPPPSNPFAAMSTTTATNSSGTLHNPFAPKSGQPNGFGNTAGTTQSALGDSAFGTATQNTPSTSPFPTSGFVGFSGGPTPKTNGIANGSPFAPAADASAPVPATASPFAAPLTKSAFGNQCLSPAMSTTIFGNQNPPATGPSMASSFGTAKPTIGFGGQNAAAPASSPFSSNQPQSSAATPFSSQSSSAGTPSLFSSLNNTAKASPFGNPSTSEMPPSASSFGTPSMTGGSSNNPFAKRPSSAHGPAALPSNPFTTANKDATAPAAALKQLAQPTATPNRPATWSNQVEAAYKKAETAAPSDYATAIQNVLSDRSLNKPRWPSDPDNSQKMDKFREEYKEYRSKARKILMKKGLIDDPDVPKFLEDAIDFKGLCEDMCPEFEKITRIVQRDVKAAERESNSRDGKIDLDRMVKALARSSAGQEAPLPTDVRTAFALWKTVSYLFNDLIQHDGDLPKWHNFLWDRTRAVRRDFVFHSYMTNEDLDWQIRCLEAIARFHVTALHLLSQPDFALEDFSAQQEVEQLSKTLISLLQAYDDRHTKGTTNPDEDNEAEFRAYSILLNARDPDFQQRLREWDSKYWYQSDTVQTAVSLVQAMQNIWSRRGPLRPGSQFPAPPSAFSTVFRIVEDKKISYTMACFAEIHFTSIRQCLLRNLKSYARTKDVPRDITASALNALLRFDTDEEAVEFAKLHGLQFKSDADKPPYLVIDRSYRILDANPSQAHSRTLVERKRQDKSLADVIFHTRFEPGSESKPSLAAPASQAGNEPNALKAGSSSSNVFSKPQATFLQQSARSEAPKASAPVSVAAPASTGFPSFQAPTQALQPFSNQTSGTPSRLTNGAQSTETNDNAAAKPSDQSNVFASPAKPLPAPPANPFAQLAAGSSGSQQPLGTPKSMESTQPGNFTSGSTASSLFKPGSQPLEPKPAVGLASQSIFSPQPAKAAENTSVATQPPSIFQTAQEKAYSVAPSSLFTQKPQTEDPPISGPPVGLLAPSSQPVATPSKPSTPQSIFSSTSPSQVPAENSTQAPKSLFPMTTKATPPPPPQPRSNPMANFASWIVEGDQGLMEEFRNSYVEHLLGGVYLQWQAEEEERVRKEADAKSWSEALEYRRHNLMVKFFRRWHRVAQNASRTRRLLEGKRQMIAYQQARRDEQRAAKRKAKENTEASRRSSREANDFIDNYRASKRQRSVSEDTDGSSVAAALLATGVLDDLLDRQAAASTIAKRNMSPPGPPSTISTTSRKVVGLKRHRLSNSVSAINGVPTSILGRRSASINGEGSRFLSPPAANEFRKTLPAGSSTIGKSFLLRKKEKVTNFSQSFGSRSVMSDGWRSESPSNSKSSHWYMRSIGMLRMPNGQYLHESLAVPMLEGKRFSGIGDYGLGPRSTDESLDGADAAIGEEAQHQYGPSRSPSPNDMVGKRKRRPEDFAEAPEEDVASPTESKKVKTAGVAAAQAEDIIRQMREAVSAMDEGGDWFREQRLLMEKGESPWDR